MSRARTFCGAPCTHLVQFGETVGRWHNSSVVSAVTCTQCAYVGFIPPTEEMLSDYYAKEYGKSSSDWYNLGADYAPDKVKSRADRTISLAKQYISYSTPVVLEIGCAFGGTVRELRERGIEAYGSDLNSNAISQGQSMGNSYIFDGPADQVLNALGKKVSLIYCYHALEHIPDPGAFLISLKPCLSEEAILEFRVPNGTYIRAWLAGFEKWDWFAFPDHLHMFTPRSILCLAERAGYEILSVSSGYCGESAESLINLIAAHPEFLQSNSARLLECFLEEKMLMLELIFILCKKNSATSELFRNRIDVATKRCKSNESFELSLK